MHRRRGVILVAVLVCLAVATGMFLVVVRQTLAERRAMRANQREMQAVWLAEAALERAVARVAADAAYVGETWSLGAKEFASDKGAVVRIVVEPIVDQSQRRSIRVEADYPDAPEQRCRRVKRMAVDREAILADESKEEPTPEEGRQNTGETL